MINIITALPGIVKMISLSAIFDNIRDPIESFKNITIPKLPVFSTEEGIKQIRNNLDKILDWKDLYELIPKFYSKNKMKKTGIAGIFAACLELTKEGVVSVSQKKNI